MPWWCGAGKKWYGNDLVCGSYIVSDPPLRFKDTFLVVVLGSRAFNSEHGIRGLHIFCWSEQGIKFKGLPLYFRMKERFYSRTEWVQCWLFPNPRKVLQRSSPPEDGWSMLGGVTYSFILCVILKQRCWPCSFMYKVSGLIERTDCSPEQVEPRKCAMAAEERDTC